MFANSKIVSTFATANERKNGCKERKRSTRMARSSIGEDARFSFLKGGFDSPTGYKIKK